MIDLLWGIAVADIPQATTEFREGRELQQFGMDEKDMKILRVERYIITPATDEATLSETHYPVEQPL